MAELKAVSLEDDYYDLGAYSRLITTNSKSARIWFNRGLIWTYGFHHEEAAHCYELAITHDASFSMAYWGLAYALGPNYNKPWEFFEGEELESTVKRTHRAVQEATTHSTSASPVEKALINALQYRYPDGKPAKDFSIWNKGYADAMKNVYEEFSDDLDVASLYADSLMNLTPWALWDIRTGEPAPGAHTLEIKYVLESAIALPNGKQHPGLLHLYIHLMEMSPHPEFALPLANHLRGLVPDSGHLNHMPTHLDILCGNYSDAMTWNGKAIAADEKYLLRSGPLNFYTLYRCHDYHFRIYAAMFAGSYTIAISTVSQLESTLPSSLLLVKSPPMADWLETFLSIRIHVLIRFGKWDDLITLPLPSNPSLYSATTAFTHYGKAIAHAASNHISLAEHEHTLFKTAVTQVPQSRTLFNNPTTSLLAIASSMLDGEIAYRKRLFSTAFTHLKHAIHLDDNLHYDEPWGWMQPTRHAYGALLLEQGRVEEAKDVYSADLGYDETLPRALRHPRNVWALCGYEECLRRLGRVEEAEKVGGELSTAMKGADVEVESSCFCRRGK